MTSIMHNRNIATATKSTNLMQARTKSLNGESRRQKIIKITLENQSILKRLQDKASFYKVQDWETDFQRREAILKKMCEYPYILQRRNLQNHSFTQGSDPNQSQIGSKPNTSLMDPFGSLSTAQGGSRLPRLNNSMIDQSNSNNQSNNATSYGAWNNKITKGDLVVRQAGILDENRIVLYKRGKQIANGYYIVEISSNNTHLFIAAYDVESPESLLIEIPEAKAQNILLQFKNDYDQIASSLNIANKRLMLLNPKYALAKRAVNSGQGSQLQFSQNAGNLDGQTQNSNRNQINSQVRSLTTMNFYKARNGTSYQNYKSNDIADRNTIDNSNLRPKTEAPNNGRHHNGVISLNTQSNLGNFSNFTQMDQQNNLNTINATGSYQVDSQQEIKSYDEFGMKIQPQNPYSDTKQFESISQPQYERVVQVNNTTYNTIQ
eukprot:403372221